MKRMNGTHAVNDDEWYTPRKTADRVADWLARSDGGNLSSDTSILCPADLLPDGSESQIPAALRQRGFTNVRVTRDLPLDNMFCDYLFDANGGTGEVIVTNPPFSLLCPFRLWLRSNPGIRYCVLGRPCSLDGWPIVEMKDKFYTEDKPRKSVAAAWFQNMRDTRRVPLQTERAIGDCGDCESPRCPNTIHCRDWKPGQHRPLFGWCVAIQNGLGGHFCNHYIKDGKRKYARFFDKQDAV